MSASPEAPSTAGPAVFGEAPPGAARVLAGIDIAAAGWLAFLMVVLRHATAEGVGLYGATPHADVWLGWLVLTVVFGFFLLLISVASLVTVPVRAQPRIFRVLLGGTLALALVIPAFVVLSDLGLSF